MSPPAAGPTSKPGRNKNSGRRECRRHEYSFLIVAKFGTLKWSRAKVALTSAIFLVAAACGGGAATSTEASGSTAAPAAEAGSSSSGSESSGGAEAVPASLLSGQFETLTGGNVDLEAFEGEDVVFWFWAPGDRSDVPSPPRSWRSNKNLETRSTS